ncbi:uncharacterized protein UTRI_06207_B [Ustilago trichophora]|uniref:ABM domain-containing protein n=1 Tax=Ustilago trichophora TaxID=86804 RepID=A0A5C3EH56_9BASI|nr:uncharacterized protein UTRI_06207_B [Ustilago trichophora]
MRVQSASFKAVTFIFLSCLVQLSFAGRTAFLSPAIDGTLPSSLRIFVDRLAGFDGLGIAKYHSAIDLQSYHVHQRFSRYLFENGQNFNPSLLYLGKDPESSTKHLAVAYFEPDRDLMHRIRPQFSHISQYAKRKGVLAIKMVSHDEPEFVGVLWFKDMRTAKKLKEHIDRNNLVNLENDERIGLKDVQRVIHHLPI